ncbi:XkdX family protein [Bacillus sp. L381]|uniref:XkdX family protein n=1 Tax=Bacillus TaxID=1386 RepID=UPI0020121CEE|nr:MULTISPECIES: XkdX family protein [Bacillus]MCR9040963.1 XkdX family protein [Bacillus velezensis]WIX20065.1 XkdX family protein [Bacillus sp. L381]
MEMDWFTRIKDLYDSGLWTKKKVHDTVGVGRITPEQYKEITGDTYDPDNPPVDE